MKIAKVISLILLIGIAIGAAAGAGSPIAGRWQGKLEASSPSKTTAGD